MISDALERYLDGIEPMGSTASLVDAFRAVMIDDAGSFHATAPLLQLLHEDPAQLKTLTESLLGLRREDGDRGLAYLNARNARTRAWAVTLPRVDVRPFAKLLDDSASRYAELTLRHARAVVQADAEFRFRAYLYVVELVRVLRAFPIPPPPRPRLTPLREPPRAPQARWARRIVTAFLVGAVTAAAAAAWARRFHTDPSLSAVYDAIGLVVGIVIGFVIQQPAVHVAWRRYQANAEEVRAHNRRARIENDDALRRQAEAEARHAESEATILRLQGHAERCTVEPTRENLQSLTAILAALPPELFSKERAGTDRYLRAAQGVNDILESPAVVGAEWLFPTGKDTEELLRQLDAARHRAMSVRDELPDDLRPLIEDRVLAWGSVALPACDGEMEIAVADAITCSTTKAFGQAPTAPEVEAVRTRIAAGPRAVRDGYLAAVAGHVVRCFNACMEHSLSSLTEIFGEASSRAAAAGASARAAQEAAQAADFGYMLQSLAAAVERTEKKVERVGSGGGDLIGAIAAYQLGKLRGESQKKR